MKESGGDAKKTVVISKPVTRAASNTTREQCIMVKNLLVQNATKLLQNKFLEEALVQKA